MHPTDFVERIFIKNGMLWDHKLVTESNLRSKNYWLDQMLKHAGMELRQKIYTPIRVIDLRMK